VKRPVASKPARTPTRIAACLGLLLAVCASWAGCGGGCSTIDSLDLPPFSPVAYPDRIDFDGRPLAVLGDTQRTSWQECRFLGRRVNDREQGLLIRSLASEGAGAIVILGDMVFRASDPQHWSFFNRLMKPIRETNTPVLALMGNHEYTGDDVRARSLVGQHFPRLASNEYYAERYGRLGLVFLNSNKNKLGKHAWSDQLQWYRRHLDDLDGDEAVDGVLVFLHHPPRTTSRIASGDRELARDFVEGFLSARKTMAMVGGHAHGFECAREQGKFFIVSAGGGGPLQERDGEALCTGDISGGPKSSAIFNYLLVEQQENGIRIEIRGLSEGDAAVGRQGMMEIPFF
jgi:hypothetical protein